MTRVVLDQAIQVTGSEKGTVCDWFNVCREAWNKVVNGDSKIVGTADRTS